MRIILFPLFTAIVTLGTWAQKAPDGCVLIEGGTFKDTKSNYYGKHVTLPSFYIGKYEVTQKEWADVMGSNPSKFKGDNLPVEMVNWYDCVEYCNKKSIKEGLDPYYNIDKKDKDPNNLTAVDDVKWTVTINPEANGYRLPTEAEWEYAAGGGQLSKSYVYSGGDDLQKVGWYWQNAGDKPLTGSWRWSVIEGNNTKTKPVGGKLPNELGLFDMSGNVREWCWDWYGNLDDTGAAAKKSSSETGRVWKGGGWIGADFCCATFYRGSYEANGRGPDQGMRLCRSRYRSQP